MDIKDDRVSSRSTNLQKPRIWLLAQLHPRVMGEEKAEAK